MLATALLGFGLCGMVACDGGLAFDLERAVHQSFSGERALLHVERQMKFGPRVAGSANLERTRQYLEQVLEELGWQVKRQVFKQKTPSGEVEFVNLRVRFVGESVGDQGGEKKVEARVWQNPVSGLVVSHYETKNFEAFEFLGANDPGSSVGVLLEMARVLSERPAVAEKLELVFFDGEEAFVDYTETDGLYGSRYYADSLKKWPEKLRPQWGVLLDMVGDGDLAIRVPVDSPDPLVGKLFAAAEDMNLRKYFGLGSQMITDDHKPLNEAGVPTIDIIDMEYDYWHTPGDTVDKLSADSLKIVGQVALLMIEKYLLDKDGL